MSVQTLPVRFAETVNRFGAPRAERVGPSAEESNQVLLTLGNRTVVGRSHGERVTRRGRQTLVSVHGRLRWVDSRRVQPMGDAA